MKRHVNVIYSEKEFGRTFILQSDDYTVANPIHSVISMITDHKRVKRVIYLEQYSQL